MKTENFPFHRSRWASIIAAAAGACVTLSTSPEAPGADRFFNGPVNTGAPETWALWDDPASWVGGGVPTSEDILRIYYKQSGVDLPTTAQLASAFTAYQVTVDKGSHLYLANGAALTMDTTTDGKFFIKGNSRVTVASGAAIAWAPETEKNTYLEVNNGAVLENYGSIATPTLNILAGGTVLQKGGALVGTKPSLGMDVLGKLIVTGGVINNTEFVRMNGGQIAISGGDVSMGTLQFNSGSFHVDGSGASQIKINSFRVDSGKSASLTFTLDHTEEHVSVIRIELGDKSGNTFRSVSSLEMRLKGGVLLADQTEFTLINRAGMADGTTGWLAGPGPLWKDTTKTENGRNYVRVALNDSAKVGVLSSATPELAFEAVSQGFVDLSGIDFAEPIVLALDLTQQSSLFEAALDAAGVEWLAGEGDYELYLFLDPSKAGGSYFAWDFHDIDGTLGLQGIALGVIPEPGSWALLGLTFGGGLLCYWGRKRFGHFSPVA